MPSSSKRASSRCCCGDTRGACCVTVELSADCAPRVAPATARQQVSMVSFIMLKARLCCISMVFITARLRTTEGLPASVRSIGRRTEQWHNVVSMKTTRSQRLFARAQQLLPGGVDSPVRAFKSVGGSPLFITRASGATLVDVDGNKYIDYVMSWGPLIHGHAPKGLTAAIARAAKDGTSFGAPSPLEVTLAERVIKLMPSIERVRFVNSGTEAAMSALRVARAATKRDRIIKFQGCYHGHADAFLVQAGSGALTFGTPDSPGVTIGASKDTLVASYNDLASVHALFAANTDRISAVIVEPIAGNMGVVPPADGFLQGLRDACTANGALLIFDEVISGFRASAGGAQKTMGVRPDLTCLGKIIGGGLPVGAYGGRADLMALVSPSGPVYQADRKSTRLN